MSIFLDQYGRPLVYPQGGSGSKHFLEALDRGKNIPNRPTRFEDINKLVRLNDWQALSSEGRRQYGSNGAVRAMADDKAGASIGNDFMAVYKGFDAPWGKQISPWINDVWVKNCSIEGWPIDLQTILFLISVNMDHSGDCGILFTLREGDGWPLFQLIPAHRIGCRSNSPTITKPGQWFGMIQEFGVIKSKFGTPIGYCLLGDTPDEDQIVGSDCFLHVYDPCWIGQSRGYPALFHGLRSGKSLMATQEAEEAASLVGSRKALLLYNQTGTIDTDNPDSAANDDTEIGTVYEQQIAGIDAFRAGQGEKIEMFHNPRPGADWESFQDRSIQFMAAGAWPSELIWRPRTMSGPLVRAVQGKARRFVLDRQGLLRGAWEWMIQRAVAWAVANDVADVAAPPDWLTAWTPTIPAQITIDDGRDSQARREDVAAGHKTWSTALGELGIWDKDKHFDELVDDQFELENKIRAAEKKHRFKLDRRNFIMRTPNEAATPVVEDDGDDENDEQKSDETEQ